MAALRRPPNGIELRRNTRKPNRRRAKRAEVKAAGVVACSELLGGPCKRRRDLTPLLPRSRGPLAPALGVPSPWDRTVDLGRPAPGECPSM